MTWGFTTSCVQPSLGSVCLHVCGHLLVICRTTAEHWGMVLGNGLVHLISRVWESRVYTSVSASMRLAFQSTRMATDPD